MPYFGARVSGDDRIKKDRRAVVDATDKYAKRLAGSISTSLKHSLVRQAHARGLVGATGALTDEGAWIVKTNYRGGGNYEILFTNAFAPYAGYINRPGGPYQGNVDYALLKMWMEKRYGCITPQAVMGMKRRIENEGHRSQRGAGFVDAAMKETSSRMKIMVRQNARQYADDIWSNITSGAL